MSKNNVLYVKGMQISNSEEDEEVVDVWDDTDLDLAYDSALRFAKRAAAAAYNIDGFSDDKNYKNKSSSKPTVAKNKCHFEEWKAGMHCRAIYENDGLEYEATVISVIDDSECVIKFLGYDESVVVPLKRLKSSRGKSERAIQIKNAAVENENEETSNAMGYNFDHNCEPSVNQNAGKKKKSSQRKHKAFELPNMSLPMPNLMGMRNMGSIDLPPPPPLPPNILSDRQDTEGQALSSMLISWYMSGFHTGLYHGLSRKRDHSNIYHKTH